MSATDGRSAVIAAGRTLEVRRIATGSNKNPIVMLHEGLGSVAMWRDFPDRLAAATGRDVVAYSRYGYGQSDPLDGTRDVAYMHDEACVALPAVLAALDIECPVLFGHSDGASIALIYAATFPERVEALVLEAPHVFVEPLTIKSIAKMKVDAANGDFIERLGRYHADPRSAFRGWNDIWLHPDFRAWNITALLPAVVRPVLLLQGRDDEYGSVAQLEATTAAVRSSTSILIDDCGHSPHRSQARIVLDATAEFLQKVYQNA